MDNNSKEGQVFASHYYLKKQLGRGGFSEVWLAEDMKAGIDVAIKIYAPGTGLGTTGSAVFRNEFSLVFNLNHSNLLRPTYFDIEDNMPYLVMPYIRRGSVNKLVGRMAESDMWRLIHDVASGLAYLHSMEVIHQDIKPDNIMVADDGNYLITDFGVSTRARSTLRKSVNNTSDGAGTRAYMAPERFSSEPLPVKANDIWSLGATAFELMTGDVPFGEMGGVLEKGGAEIPTIYGDYSDELKTLVESCLAKEPWDRPMAAKLVEISSDVIRGKHHVEDKKIETEEKQDDMAKTVLKGVKLETNNQVQAESQNHDEEEKPVEKKKNKTVIYVVAAVVVIGVVLALLLTGKREPKPEPQLQPVEEVVEIVMTDTIPAVEVESPVEKPIEPVKEVEQETPKAPAKTNNVAKEKSNDNGETTQVNYKARFVRLVGSVEALIAKANNPYDVNSLLSAKNLCDSLQFYRNKLGYDVYKDLHKNVKARVDEKIETNYNALINEAKGYVENATTDSFDDYEAAIADYELAIKLKYDAAVDYEIQRLKNIAR